MSPPLPLKSAGAHQRYGPPGPEKHPAVLGFIRVYNKKDSEAIRKNEKALDAFEDELETYLVKISSMQLSLENSMQVSKLSHAIGNFERIGDYAVNILKPSAPCTRTRFTSPRKPPRNWK